MDNFGSGCKTGSEILDLKEQISIIKNKDVIEFNYKEHQIKLDIDAENKLASECIYNFGKAVYKNNKKLKNKKIR